MHAVHLIGSLSAFALAGSFCLLSAQPKKTWTEAEALKIHKESYLVDLHIDVPMLTAAGRDFSLRGFGQYTDAICLKEGGMGGQLLVGIDHVAIRGDFDAMTCTPQATMTPANFPTSPGPCSKKGTLPK